MPAGFTQIPEILEDPPHPLAAWFDDFRAERQAFRDRVDPETGRHRSRALITMVHNEPFFFPIWLGYYSRFFRPEDIFVLDHDTDDGSLDGGGFNRLPSPREDFDNRWQVERVESLQRDLLERYDMVLAVDVDEIVVPDPRLGDLGAYMDRFDEPFVSCMGYEMVHLPDREPAFDPGRPVMEQRRYWSENAAYNKSSLSTTPSQWEPGFHRRIDKHFRGDPDLLLVHLHRVDYEICRARHERWSDRTWGETDLNEGWGVHNRVAGGEDFDRWFFNETGFEGFPLRIEEIPEDWRKAF